MTSQLQNVSAASMGTHTVLAVDAGFPTTRSADHLLTVLAQRFESEDDSFGCTHFERGEHPRVIITLDVPGDLRAAGENAALDIVLATIAEELTVAGLPRDVGVLVGSTGFGGADELVAAATAADAHRTRASGRAVVYPGYADMVGAMTAGELLEASAIDVLDCIGSPAVADADLIDTRGFVRPHWENGVLTLDLMPAVGGVLVPFEVPNPTPCCADHAT